MKNISTILPTPFFYYDLDQVINNINAYKHLFNNHIRILYATMANPRPEVLEAVRDAGIGVFVNSISHLDVALKIGINSNNIVFAGSGHNSNLLKFISSTGVDYHADSLNQLQEYLSFSPKGKIGVRVNVGSLLNNPDIDPAPRLGMLIDEIDKSIAIYPDRISTLHVYVGTNLLDSDMHCRCLNALVGLSKKYNSISDIDLGGGFAFAPGDKYDYRVWNDVIELWKLISHDIGNVRLTIEPGRSIVRTAGHFYLKVTDLKHRNKNIFATVDSSGTWFPRKIVHDIDEDIISVVGKERQNENLRKTHICGSTTFSKDYLSISYLPELSIGDIICFPAAGAYNESMHLDFLGIPSPGIVVKRSGKEIIVKDAPLSESREVLIYE